MCKTLARINVFKKKRKFYKNKQHFIHKIHPIRLSENVVDCSTPAYCHDFKKPLHIQQKNLFVFPNRNSRIDAIDAIRQFVSAVMQASRSNDAFPKLGKSQVLV